MKIKLNPKFMLFSILFFAIGNAEPDNGSDDGANPLDIVPDLDDNSYKCETTSYRMQVTFANEKLCILYEDLINWVVYYREYSQNDIGGDIYRKVDLADIHYSLTNAFPSQNNNDIKDYTFGQIIKKKNIPYYKVQEGGEITVYVSMIDQRKQQKIEYQSKLKLTKKSEMTEVEIYKEKFAALNYKYSKMQTVINNQKTQISSLEQQVTTKDNIIRQNLDLKTKLEKIPNNFTVCYPTSSNYFNYVFPKVIPYGEQYKFKILISSAGSRYVSIGVVDYTKYNSTVQQLYGQNFTVCYFWHTQNQGYKYPGNIVEGSGYKAGETVQVSVDLANQRVSWSVSGTVRATHTHQILADRSRIFMPFVQSYYVGTNLQWVN